MLDMNENQSFTMPLSTTETAPAAGAQHGSLSPKEAETMATWLRQDLDAGKLSRERFDESMRQLGVDPATVPPDTRSKEERQFDEAFPTAKPGDFTLRWFPPGQDQELTEPMQQLDTNARTWLSGAGFSKETGDSLVRQIDRVVGETVKLTDADIEARGQREFAKLERVYGPNLEAKLKQAGELVSFLEQRTPGLRQLLQMRGIGDDSLVASLLIQQAERYFARRGK